MEHNTADLTDLIDQFGSHLAIQNQLRHKNVCYVNLLLFVLILELSNI
jgi:hypothetical protein